MAVKPRRRKPPVRLRHKVLGFLLTLLGLTCMAGCGLLTGYLMDNLLTGSTLEIIVFDVFIFVMGIIFLFMAWHQFVVAPKQDEMRESFQTYRRNPPLDKPRDQTT